MERLEEAIAEDAKKDESKRKRKRNLDSSDGADESNKLIAIGELRAMNVKELREEASKRGLVETGTKKDLLERLCNDANNDSIAPVKSGIRVCSFYRQFGTVYVDMFSVALVSRRS